MNWENAAVGSTDADARTRAPKRSTHTNAERMLGKELKVIGSSVVMAAAPSGLASRRNWIALFVLGTINNLAYVVVLSGASSMAKSFNASSEIGLINYADVALGLVAKAGAPPTAAWSQVLHRLIITDVVRMGPVATNAGVEHVLVGALAI